MAMKTARNSRLIGARKGPKVQGIMIVSGSTSLSIEYGAHQLPYTMIADSIRKKHPSRRCARDSRLTSGKPNSINIAPIIAYVEALKNPSMKILEIPSVYTITENNRNSLGSISCHERLILPERSTNKMNTPRTTLQDRDIVTKKKAGQFKGRAYWKRYRRIA